MGIEPVQRVNLGRYRGMPWSVQDWDEWKKSLPTEFLDKKAKKQVQPALKPEKHDKSWAEQEAEKDRKSHEEYDAKGWDHIFLKADEFKQISDLIRDDLLALNRWDISEVALKRVAFHFMDYTHYFTVVSSNMLHLRSWVDLPEEKDGTWDVECDLQFTRTGIKLRFPAEYARKDGSESLYEFLVSEDENGRQQFETFAMMFMTLNYFLLHYGEIAFQVKEIVCKKPSRKRAAPTADKDRKVRLIKSYTLKRGWKNKVERKKAEIRCLAWGVRGHYRHYKNGRTIYIAPFVKGKEREKYAGKEYVLLPKDNTKGEQKNESIQTDLLHP